MIGHNETIRFRPNPGDGSSRDRLHLAAMIAGRMLPLVTGGLLSSGLAQAALLTVNDKADPGSAGDRRCTLREAIASINTGAADPDCPNGSANPLGNSDNIIFGPGLTGETIKLAGSALVITADVGMIGPDPGNPKEILISANEMSRVFEITGSDIDVTLNSFTLRDGMTASSGGAVLLDSAGAFASELTLIDTIVTESSADGNGGALSVGYRDSITLNNCGLYKNVAGVRGGALSASIGTVSIFNSSIESNEADNGAVYLQGNATTPSSIVIDDSIVQNNRGASNGSAVFVVGAASTVFITDSSIRNNDGRGVVVSSAELSLTRATISGHMAATANGAGVFAFDAEVTIQESTIANNTTSINGGGLSINNGTLTLENTTVSGNSAGNGGGLHLIGSSPMAVISSTVSHNSATYFGGAISSGGDLTVAHSTLSGNTAGQRGGGIAVGNGETLELRFSTLSHNSSGLDGSSISASGTGASQITAGLIVNGQGGNNCETDVLPNVLAPSLSDDDSCVGFIENAAAGMRLGLLADNGGPTLTHALFAGNPAIDGGGAVCDNTDQRAFLKPVDGDDNGLADCDIGAVEFIDSDFDDVIDFYETANGLAPNDSNAPNGGGDDLDMDGVTNQDEFEAGLAADNPDSDGDILGDGIDHDPASPSNACMQDGLGDAQFDFTAMSGMVTQCAAENSITVLDAATSIIEAGAVLQLYSPTVSFQDGAAVPQTAEVEVNAVDPTPGMTP